MRLILFLLIVIAPVVVVHAQDSLKAQANQAMQRKDFASAQQKMETYLKSAPSDDWAKTTLAVAMLYQSEVPAAQRVLQSIDTSKAKSLKAEVYYLSAKIALLGNDKATALADLRRTAEAGGRAYYIQ